MKPYPHQTSFIQDIRASLAKHKRVIGCASTGAGKTVCIGDIINRARGHVIVTVHRRELLRQTQKTLDIMGCSNYTLTTIQTLTKQDFEIPSLLIVDECHLSMAKTWRSVIEKCPYVIGFTATPCRLDGQPLGELYNDIVYAKDMKWLIQKGFLSEYKYHAPYVPDMKGVRKSMGDFAISDTLERMSGKVLSNALDKYLEICGECKYTMAFCVNVAHSKELVERATSMGINAVHIDGTMTEKQRKEAIQCFADKGGILSNVNITTEGFDLSAQVNQDITVEAVLILRPTQSLALHRQIVGRALRRKPRPAHILDFAGNVQRHDFPDDFVEWSLDGKTRRESDTISIQRCPDCFMVQRPSPICMMCGHVFQADGRIIEEIDGELLVIDSDTWHSARREQVQKAHTLEELVKIEKARGYKMWWSENIYAKKYGKRPSIEETARVRGYNDAWIWRQRKVRG